MRDTLLIINTILSFPTLPFLRNKQHKTQNFCYVSLFQRPRFVAYFIGGSCFDFDLSFWSEVVRVGMVKGWLDLWFMIKTCQSGWNEKKGLLRGFLLCFFAGLVLSVLKVYPPFCFHSFTTCSSVQVTYIKVT